MSLRVRLCGGVLVLAISGSANAQTISITGVPTYGTLGHVTGSVSGVVFANYRVAGFIYIDGKGWYTKPTLAAPLVAIAPDGRFDIDVGTGGAGSLDPHAVVFCAALVPALPLPPAVEGAPSLPSTLAPLALDCEQRYGRVIQFSGYDWGVKQAPSPVEPGKNVFSGRPEDVFVDAEGLHLRIAYHDGKWWASEVVLLAPQGHGVYHVWTKSPVDQLDRNATLGLFTWDPWGDDTAIPAWPFREIDLEDSRWGIAADPTAAQMAVQLVTPATELTHLHRYALPDLSADARLTRYFIWQPDGIHFAALRGYHPPLDHPASALIDEFVFPHDPASGRIVPTPGRAAFRLNLWLNNTLPPRNEPVPQPADGAEIEVVVERVFVPEPSAWLNLGVLGLAAAWLTRSPRARPKRSRGLSSEG